MADSTIDPSPGDPALGGRHTSPAVIHQILEALVASTEPAVVFASLVRLSVPRICDVATATLNGPDEKVYAVSWPRDAVAHPWRTNVVVRFDAVGTGRHGAFHGEVTLGFGSSECCQPYVAQLLVDRVMATVERERLLESVARSVADVANLELALVSKCEISVAVGILMSAHELSTDGAFDLLRQASQNGNRKLREVALEVTRTQVDNRG